MNTSVRKIRGIYRALRDSYGPQHWWPAKTSFEVVVGAYLTQNTSWNNVDKALKSLRKAGKLDVAGIRSLSLERLGRLIRASGYFRQKARALKTFIQYLDAHHAGSLRRMFARHRGTPFGWQELRRQLLHLHGVGKETADSILLYAGNLPIFVVDSYTRRIFARHAIISADAGYEEIRQLVETALPAAAPFAEEEEVLPGRTALAIRRNSARQFNEMHAWLVQVGKDYCFKTTPACDACPLGKLLPSKKPRVEARSTQR